MNNDATSSWTPEPEDVALPLAAMLLGSGIEETEALRLLKKAMAKVRTQKKIAEFMTLPNAPLLRDVICEWQNNTKYLTPNGRPKNLRLRGKSSFEELVASVSPDAHPGEVLDSLVNWNNVEITRSTRLRLCTKFLIVRRPGGLAYEPTLRFLADAYKAASVALVEEENSNAPNTYWRLLESRSIPEDALVDFRKLSGRRSLQLLEELDAWIKEKENDASSSKRVSVGFFVLSERRKSGESRQ